MRTRFVLTVLVATTLSTAVFAAVLAADGSPHVATLLRLVVATPILYVGLRGLGDPLRVGLAIVTSTGLKLALEPLLTAMVLRESLDLAMVVPLIGDLAYGPIILFAMLRSVHHRRLALA
jgi:hypothetical protein